MLVEKYLPRYTVEDYSRWEGDWELIEGIPYAFAPSPFGLHQRVSTKISHLILTEIEKCKENKISVYMELDWIINNNTVVRPDVSITCDDVPEYIKHPPEAIFEVVSKTSAIRDEELKFELYRREGVRYYIIVYPEIKKVRGFILENKQYEKIFDGDTGVLRLDLCHTCQAEIDVSKIF